ncbi:mRNA interferase RelE/StbE [Kribbella sp. VKM Ac-2527]|uniref:mRNA interferase RelE/StbE n=1 Tax=Kribbella caucasensis TaxID=2512215 RepID=A0A4R6KN19_9ACTN|nr:type II toxin-antitoxin system RelE/ParE family toxin [Kribbella sp. VKM Ac-2527]TDO52681.1 mRNA interferase RelE/StbE [Kribbella sp. VKM Ac-2527]
MSYTIVWRPAPVAALRELRRLDPDTAKALAATVGTLATDPRPANSRPLGSGQFRRLRLQNLRVLYEVSDEQETVYILKIGSAGR